jgi:hypothetical protein
MNNSQCQMIAYGNSVSKVANKRPFPDQLSANNIQQQQQQQKPFLSVVLDFEKSNFASNARQDGWMDGWMVRNGMDGGGGEARRRGKSKPKQGCQAE